MTLPRPVHTFKTAMLVKISQRLQNRNSMAASLAELRVYAVSNHDMVLKGTQGLFRRESKTL